MMSFCVQALAAHSSTPAFWQWAPTPPMGWNSYDAYGTSINEEDYLKNAGFMEEKLLPHGWKYAVIDARWYDSSSPSDDRDFNKKCVGAKLFSDQYGRLIPAPNRFPSSVDGAGFKPLAEKIHAMGLKFGIHVMRGIPRQSVNAGTPIEGSKFTAADAGDTNNTCSWCPDMFGVQNNEAGQAWYDSWARLWASWGVDFVKIDDLSKPYSTHEVEMIRKAIDKTDYPIVFSTSPGPTDPGRGLHVARNANMWRISGDFWDRWDDLNRAFDLIAQWQGGGGPGHFPDADMIPIGHLGIHCTIAGNERQTRFTPDEQKTLLSLWAIAPSPLMLGNALPNTDPATLALITNDEVLAINQDKLAAQARRILQHLGTEIWIKNLADGSQAIGFFNRDKEPQDISITWKDFGMKSPSNVRDLWEHKDLGSFPETFTRRIPSHGSALYLIPSN
jgi:alpha-galactosidase